MSSKISGGETFFTRVWLVDQLQEWYEKNGCEKHPTHIHLTDDMLVDIGRLTIQEAGYSEEEAENLEGRQLLGMKIVLHAPEFKIERREDGQT
jgi:hypothetical protein